MNFARQPPRAKRDSHTDYLTFVQASLSDDYAQALVPSTLWYASHLDIIISRSHVIVNSVLAKIVTKP